MQFDLFGRPIGSCSSLVDIFGQEHQSIAKMIEFWSDKYDSLLNLESPPHNFLRANPVATALATKSFNTRSSRNRGLNPHAVAKRRQVTIK